MFLQEVAEIIRTCYVNQSCALTAIIEGARYGFVEVVRVLLQAGTLPNDLEGKTPLHVACENGHENVARLLISHLPSREEILRVTGDGRTAFDILRQNDLGGVCRRLEAFLNERFVAT